MTLKDIAKKANVSISTVSRVLNSPDGTFGSQEVREQIWKIVRETGYVPNKAARELRKNKKSTKGTFTKTNKIVCILGKVKSLDEDPFFSAIGHAIEQEALKLNYVVNAIYSTTKDYTKENLDVMLSSSAAGAIVIGSINKNIQTILNKKYNYIVYTGLQSMNVEWDQVVCDAYQIAKDCVEYLYKMGHRKIGYIGKTKDHYRYKGYLDMMKILGLEINPSYIVPCANNTFKEGYKAIDIMIRNNTKLPTAIFCASDNVAIPSIKKLTEVGINIPKDISLIGVHNYEMDQYTTPMLSSVDIPEEQLGKSAVRHLIDRIEHGNIMPAKIILPHKLICRDSVSNIN